MEEFFAVHGDDDLQYVGTLSQTGFFTPNIEGPNPKRKFSRNNYGDVWAVASYTGPDAAPQKDGKPLTAKCYLIVTVPQYMRWDQPEVAQ
jgi:quinohemoprotein amine dehydrogenase